LTACKIVNEFFHVDNTHRQQCVTLQPSQARRTLAFKQILKLYKHFLPPLEVNFEHLPLFPALLNGTKNKRRYTRIYKK
jgi:hypothetical protein